MNTSVFDALRQIAYEKSGIAIRQNKGALMSARIGKRMRHLGIQSEGQYLDYLRADRTGTEIIEFLDAITTNFTSFFREPDHFDLLREEVDGWLREGRRTLRVWCAASSTGEEPYSLAMTMTEALARTELDFRILATDISLGVLKTATAGTYPASRLAQVPRPLLQKYFVPVDGDSATDRRFRIKEEIRSRILFKRLNLALPPFPIRGELNVVFCRNVMIYFDTEVRQRLISEIERLLRPGGLLVVAHSETLNGISSELVTLRPSVYRRGEP